MQLTTHLAVGAAVGIATGNPILGFFAGFVSHHIIDAIPHTDGGSLQVDVRDFARDKRILAIVIFDITLSLILSIFLIGNIGTSWPMIFGAIGGALPDIIDNMPFWSPKLRKTFPFDYYHRFHEKLHFTILKSKYMWLGVLTQLILIALSLTYIFTQ